MIWPTWGIASTRWSTRCLLVTEGGTHRTDWVCHSIHGGLYPALMLQHDYLWMTTVNCRPSNH